MDEDRELVKVQCLKRWGDQRLGMFYEAGQEYVVTPEVAHWLRTEAPGFFKMPAEKKAAKKPAADKAMDEPKAAAQPKQRRRRSRAKKS
jgi:hypothetical protein